MRKFNYLFLILLLTSFCFVSCEKSDSKGEVNPNNNNNSEEPNTPDPKNPESSDEIDFAYGCDPSWVTEMESKSWKFYDADGNEKECFELLKSIGFNAARFRVWVDPRNEKGYGPWCDKNDVVAKAKRASDLGYKIMIDFHYSDNWADPGKQWKPAAWDTYTTIEELSTAAYAHTKDVLSAVKEAGVDVTWVQIGNETTNGMMTAQSDESSATLNCSFSTGTDNYIKVHNKAAQAVKEVYPDSKIVVHFDRGHNWDKFSWGLDKLIKGGAEFDIFGLSIYPIVTTKNWYSIYVDAVITNLQKVIDTYNKDVMICETGSPNIATYDAKRAINDIVVRAQQIDRCKGVFYWEPQCYGSWNNYDKGGFLSSGKPSEALSVFDGKHTELLPAEDPNTTSSDADVLFIADHSSAEQLCTLEKQEDGTYSGIVNDANGWLNFTVTDKDGNKYGPTSWDDQSTIQKATSTFNHFYINNNGTKGNYKLTFDLENKTYSCEFVE